MICAWIAVFDGGQVLAIINTDIELEDTGVLTGHNVRERERRGRGWVVDASRVWCGVNRELELHC